MIPFFSHTSEQNLALIKSRTSYPDLLLHLGGSISLEEEIDLDVTVVRLDCYYEISQTADYLFVIEAVFLLLERPVLHVPKIVRMRLAYSTFFAMEN